MDETRARQDAIRELKESSDLRERVALLGEFDFSESKCETFAEWLDSPTLPLNRALRLVIFATSTLLASMVLVGFATNLVPWSTLATWIAAILAFHGIVGLMFRRQVNRTLEFLRPVSTETQVLRQGLQLLEDQKFESAKLSDLAGRVRNAAKFVRKLERHLNALSQRTQPWFYGPSLALLFGTQMCMAIEAWRIEHRANLRIWLDAWAEFEALNALATYA